MVGSHKHKSTSWASHELCLLCRASFPKGEARPECDSRGKGPHQPREDTGPKETHLQVLWGAFSSLDMAFSYNGHMDSSHGAARAGRSGYQGKGSTSLFQFPDTGMAPQSLPLEGKTRHKQAKPLYPSLLLLSVASSSPEVDQPCWQHQG